MRRIFVTGIGTGVGKTITSAILCKALGADYWKPVQCGDLGNSDTMRVKKLSGDTVNCHNEAYSFKNGLSPHAAAAKEGVEIDIYDIHLPPTNNTLIIEGAGGILVPLNHRHTMIDFIKEIDAEVIVVSKHYLGSINHTLLTLFALHSYDVPIQGVIYVGAENPTSENIIAEISQAETIGRIDWCTDLGPEFITRQAGDLNQSLKTFL